MLNLTTYLPTPFEMVCGKWTITSPVPTVETGKLITLFHQIEAEQARRAEAGEAPLIEEHVDGWPPTKKSPASSCPTPNTTVSSMMGVPRRSSSPPLTAR